MPPSVQILRNVAPVAHAAPSSHAFFSIAFSSSRGVYDTSHLEPVCFSNDDRISCGVAVKEFTIRIVLDEDDELEGRWIAATRSFPTLFFLLTYISSQVISHYETESKKGARREGERNALIHSSKSNLPLPITQEHSFPLLDIPAPYRPHLIIRDEHITIRTCDEIREVHILHRLRIRSYFQLELVRFLVRGAGVVLDICPVFRGEESWDRELGCPFYSGRFGSILRFIHVERWEKTYSGICLSITPRPTADTTTSIPLHLQVRRRVVKEATRDLP